MDENRAEGTMRNASGKVEEGVGRLTGDARTKAEGVAKQAAGTAQDLYGQTADAARETASTFDKWLRNTIETQPYTSAVVALGIGCLLGRDASPALVGQVGSAALHVQSLVCPDFENCSAWS